MEDWSPALLRAAAAVLTTLIVAGMVPFVRSLTYERPTFPSDWDIGIDLSVTSICFNFGNILLMGADALSEWQSGEIYEFPLNANKLVWFLLLAFFSINAMLFLIKSNQKWYRATKGETFP